MKKSALLVFTFALIFHLIAGKCPENYQKDLLNSIESEEISSLHKTFLLVTTHKANWHQAFINCKLLGLSLARILNEWEMNRISNMIKESDHPEEYFWIGGTDLGAEGDFRWLETGEKFTYTNWSSGQPDNLFDREHCVLLWTINGNIQMNDERCRKEKYFVCESYV